MIIVSEQTNPQWGHRAVQLVVEQEGEHESRTAAVAAVAMQLGVAQEMVRRWLVQADIGQGCRDGAPASS